MAVRRLRQIVAWSAHPIETFCPVNLGVFPKGNQNGSTMLACLLSAEVGVVPITPQPKLYLGMPAIISSPGMQHLIELVERIAQTNAAVLITGESGSGKEVIARAVHHYSLRCAKPWVDVSCAALPEH